MITQDTINLIALSKAKGISLLNARTLIDMFDSATDIVSMRHEIASRIPDATPRLVSALEHVTDYIDEAKREAEYAESKNIRVLGITDGDYPSRLKNCEDAPLVLYYYGTADLNRQKVINVIGTRKCTEYGRELCSSLISELKKSCPDVLIISGLAYGIDICAHKAALNAGLDTVGVLAHGLDTIYPTLHRGVAAQMVNAGGGLLTEYPHCTTPEKINFVRRNRIVAGVSDACIVVESAAKGGSLITAELSWSYNRDVFAFPGRVFDESSEGCNRLISSNRAALLTSAADLVKAMGWENEDSTRSSQQAVQQELFPELTDEELSLIASLRNADKKHVNQISAETGIPFARASMLLFELELKGYVYALGGAMYRTVHYKG